MLQVIKFTFLEDCELIESKVSDFMKNQSKDLDSEISLTSLIEKSLENTYDLTIDDNTSLVLLNKEDSFYLLELLKKANIKFNIEDKTSLYHKNKLQSFVPDNELQKFNEFLTYSLSIDDVLDKISESGIESLTDVDRLVLEKF